MDDLRGKVMKGIENCIKRMTTTGQCDYDCPYYHNPYGCKVVMLKDALSLIRAQETKKLRCIRRLTKVMKGICPVCEMEIESVIHGRITKFCKFCGQAVKWDE